MNPIALVVIMASVSMASYLIGYLSGHKDGKARAEQIAHNDLKENKKVESTYCRPY